MERFNMRNSHEGDISIQNMDFIWIIFKASVHAIQYARWIDTPYTLCSCWNLNSRDSIKITKILNIEIFTCVNLQHNGTVCIFTANWFVFFCCISQFIFFFHGNVIFKFHLSTATAYIHMNKSNWISETDELLCK